MHTSDTPRNPTDQAGQPTARRRDNLRQSSSLSSEAAGSQASMSSDSEAAEGATPASGASPATSSPTTDCPGQSARNIGLESGDDPDSLIRQEAAALILGVSPRCLENWRHRGGGPRWVQISSRCIRYRRSDLIQFIDERVKTNTSEDGRS
jgi:predicted DNA-binding transcriptional regulator AlpA